MASRGQIFDALRDHFLIGDGCWEWTGTLNQDGYGIIRKAPLRGMSAHRAMYQMWAGEIPHNRQIDHLCRNRRCIRPDHLEAVTQQENIKRGLTGQLNNHNRRKTHCAKGHPFDKNNTCFTRTPIGGPRRVCLLCARIGQRKARGASSPI